MPFGQGRKSYIQFGKETTWGSVAAATNRLEVISFDVGPEMGVILDPSLNDSVGRRGVFQGGIVYPGTILLRLNYEGMLKLFASVFGTAGATTEVEATAISFDHIFHDKQAQVTNKSLTIELIEGDIPTGQCQRLLGTVIEAMTVRVVPGQGQDAMMTCELSVLAKDKETGQTPTGALSAPAVLPALFHHALTIDDGVTASALQVTNLEVRYEAPHARDRFYLGSKNPGEFLRSDFVKATYRFTQDFQSVAPLTNLKAFTNASPQIVFRGNALGMNFYEFEVKSEKATVTRASVPVQGYGAISIETTIEAYQDDTLGTYYARFRNAQAAI